MEFDDTIGTFIRSLRLFYCFLVKTNTRNDLEGGWGAIFVEGTYLIDLLDSILVVGSVSRR